VVRRLSPQRLHFHRKLDFHRTCIGCRKKARASDLLRVVARVRISSGSGEAIGVFDLVPDPARVLPGRGAHLHFDPACLAQAVRRRAFGRALRVGGVTEMEMLESVLLGQDVDRSMTDGEATQASSGNQGGTTHMSSR
jgi:predicted RNA-binding protein YlxR (DUF448 family)